MAIAGYKLRINGGILTDHVIDVGLVYDFEITGIGLTGGTEYLVEVAEYDESDVLAPWSQPKACRTRELFTVVDVDGDTLVDGEGNQITALV